MQTIESFNPNLGTAIGLVGPAGSGKTVLGCRLFPKTYVIVADLNFQSGLRYLQTINEVNHIVGFDTIAIDADGKKILPLNRWDRFWKCVNEAVANPNIDAIFIDSATFITEYIMAKLVSATTDDAVMIPNDKTTFEKWGKLGVTWRSMVTQLRTSGKKLIIAIHESKNQDESDKIWKHELLIPGQTKDMLPNLLSDVWRTEVKENLGSHAWMVRTLPNPRMEMLKNTYGLDAVMPAEELVRAVRSKTPTK